MFFCSVSQEKMTVKVCSKNIGKFVNFCGCSVWLYYTAVLFKCSRLFNSYGFFCQSHVDVMLKTLE